MCGIVGIIGVETAAQQLVEGLKRLEYRGYDSAGVATIQNGKIERRRAEGKLINLQQVLQQSPLQGPIGIGHTRWATHGAPTETNAHPHQYGKVVIVHNGIIENYLELKHELQAKGHEFVTETDTEIAAHLMQDYLNQNYAPEAAFKAMIARLKGAFAFVIMLEDMIDTLFCASYGAPLAIGYGEEAEEQGHYKSMYVGSDAIALAPWTNQLSYLEEGDFAIVSLKKIEIFDVKQNPIHREIKRTTVSAAQVGKDGYRHFMEKEIHEQAVVIGDTLKSLLTPDMADIALPIAALDWQNIPQITIIACGTAYYAGCVAKYWFEQLADIPVEVDVASEFRYREGPMVKGGITVLISQSGETADTLAALRYAKQKGQRIISIVNARESTIARESHAIIPTLAGPEIGVASTKAFTTQLVVLLMMALECGLKRGVIQQKQWQEIKHALVELPQMVNQVLGLEDNIITLAQTFTKTRDAMYLARGCLYPIALEGALKLKEISYINAQSYAAGEMKHGPIALIDETLPVIIIAPHDRLFEKTLSNIQEVAARGAKCYIFTDDKGKKQVNGCAAGLIVLPESHEIINPILHVIPMQLLAYHTARLKGTDVDQPRNLAKSVTVE